MIKVSSFSIAQNFSGWTWEFDNEKMIIKTKSLMVEFEREVPYEKIQFIHNKSTANMEWLWVSFILFAILGLTRMGLDYFHVINSTIDIIEKIVTVFAFIIALLIFQKREYYWLRDKDKNTLAVIWISPKDKQALSNAIQLVKQKNETLSETYFDDQLPSTQPTFYLEELDVPDFLNKCKIGFYGNKIVAMEKSMVEEMKTVISYSELSGKTKFAKIGNDKWDSILSYWLYFLCMISTIATAFFTEQIKGNLMYRNILFGGLALLIPLFLLRYAKSEMLFFYDKKDNPIFWVTVTKKNKETLNQIIGFIQEQVGIQK